MLGALILLALIVGVSVLMVKVRKHRARLEKLEESINK